MKRFKEILYHVLCIKTPSKVLNTGLTTASNIREEFRGAFSGEIDNILYKLTESVIENYKDQFNQPLTVFYDSSNCRIIIQPKNIDKIKRINICREKIKDIVAN